MQQIEGPRTPFEVYCYACRVTFAAGTRRCVHCGGRLAGGAQPRPDFEVPHPLAGHSAAEEEEEDGPASAMRRFGGLLVWTLVAVSALVSNLCRGA